MEACQAFSSSWYSLQDQCICEESPHNSSGNKEAFLLQQRDETNLILSGFRKICLPVQSLNGKTHNNPSRPSYKRSFSDPSAGLKPSQCHSKTGCSGMICSHSSGLPPQHPSLSRSFSNPMPPRVKSVSPSSSCVGMMVEPSREVSPELKKMRRVTDCMEEIKHLCNELSQGVQDEATSQSQDLDIEPTKGWSALPSVEESVSVEKMGECLAIHFNCPCNRGYQILLSGRNCYYKLV